MNGRTITFLFGVALLALGPASSTQAEELVRQFSGERSTNTVEFDVEAPWIVDWRVSGEISRDVAVDVVMFNATTGAYEGRVLHTKSPGNGVRMFEESGRYYFRIDATLMNWSLRVFELTEEEAAAYTPKPKHILDQ